MEAYLTTIRASETVKAWVARYLRATHDQEVRAHHDIRRTQQSRYEACQQRFENLLSLKLSPANADGSLLSDEEYRDQKSRLLAEKVRLEAQLQDGEDQVRQETTKVGQTFFFACHAWEWFVNGTLEDKRHILMAIGSNLILTDKIGSV